MLKHEIFCCTSIGFTKKHLVLQVLAFTNEKIDIDKSSVCHIISVLDWHNSFPASGDFSSFNSQANYIQIMPRGHKKFMLNSTEHEINC